MKIVGSSGVVPKDTAVTDSEAISMTENSVVNQPPVATQQTPRILEELRRLSPRTQAVILGKALAIKRREKDKAASDAKSKAESTPT